MNSDNQHIDGDDYTWGGAVAGVFKSGATAAFADLRTADQVERDDIERLQAMTIALAKVLEQRIETLEETIVKLVEVLEVRL